MTAAQFVASGFLCAPEPRTRRLRPVPWIPSQQAILDAFDVLDEATGLPRYAELGYFAIKKAGKDTTLAALALASLVADRYEHEPREVVIVSGSMDQAVSVCFNQAKQFCSNHPYLAKHIRPLTSELVYVEQGATGPIEHVLRAVPGGNPSRQHGRNPNLTLFTETWLMNYELLEALAPSPARVAPRMVHGSYAGLKSQAHDGNVLWDLWQRWKRGDDRLFVSHLGGPDAWRQVPWITERFIEGERRRLAHVPQKFTRLWENEWARGDAGSFLTTIELTDAQDPTLTEPTRAIAGASLGLDLGIAKDTTGAIVTSVAADGTLLVRAVRCWRPLPGRRVSLMDVEDELVALVLRLGVKVITADQWNAALLIERLRTRLPGVVIRAVVSDAAALDRWATNLKTWFRDRAVRMPAHPALLEQLETLEAEEMRRKDRVRFTATGDAHDDLAVALCLSADGHGGVYRKARPSLMGRPRLAEMPFGCRVEAFVGAQGACVVLGGHYLPSQPACLCCEGRESLLQLHDAYLAAGGTQPLQVYRTQVVDNVFVTRRRSNNTLQIMGVI